MQSKIKSVQKRGLSKLKEEHGRTKWIVGLAGSKVRKRCNVLFVFTQCIGMYFQIILFNVVKCTVNVRMVLFPLPLTYSNITVQS